MALTPGAETNAKPLFARPQHDLFFRPSWGHTWIARGVEVSPRLFFTYELVSGIYLDRSGNKEHVPRRFHGVGLEFTLARRWHLAAELRNLGDTRTMIWAAKHIENLSV